MTEGTGGWWPTGSPWARWRRHRALERRRESWTARFFAAEIARDPELVRKCELESAPSGLEVEPLDDLHAATMAELYGAWLAAKVCARRLPTDPAAAGLDVLEVLERRGAELRAQVDHVRSAASDTAPDGGGWFPWAMSHPELGLSPDEAIRRDFRSGELSASVEGADRGVCEFRRKLRRTKMVASAAAFLPLLALAVLLAVAERTFSADEWWAALVIAVVVFVLVDRILVARVLDPAIDDRQRRLLDASASELGWLGIAALFAAMTREPPRNEAREQLP